MNLDFGSTVTHSHQETFDLGYSIGQSLQRPEIFFLEGNLGTGKTVFAKGLVCGLGQADPDDVTSPSFTLVNEYPLRLKVYHIDLYRLDTPRDVQSLDLEEIFGEPAVILVEWPEKVDPQAFGVGQVVRVKIEDLGGDDRKIEIRRLQLQPWTITPEVASKNPENGALDET